MLNYSAKKQTPPKSSFCFRQEILLIIYRIAFDMVLKTGPDQPVRPVQPSTGELFGSIRFNEPFVVKPVLNRTNRPVFCKPDKPSGFLQTGYTIETIFCLPYKRPIPGPF